MPVYLFKCLVCEHQEDYLCSADQIAKVKLFCSECKSPMKRVFTPSAIHGFEHSNQVGSSADGNYDTRKDISLTLKQLESKGRLGELSKDDIQFYQEYVKK